MVIPVEETWVNGIGEVFPWCQISNVLINKFQVQLVSCSVVTATPQGI